MRASIRRHSTRSLRSNVYEHRELAHRFGLHGVPAWFFFRRGERLGCATGWRWLELEQFAAAVVARAKMAAADDPAAGAGG